MKKWTHFSQYLMKLKYVLKLSMQVVASVQLQRNRGQCTDKLCRSEAESAVSTFAEGMSCSRSIRFLEHDAILFRDEITSEN
jgi:hypothetical protein